MAVHFDRDNGEPEGIEFIHEDNGESIDDPDAFPEEIGVDADADADVETPPWEAN